MRNALLLVLLLVSFAWSATPNFYVATTGSDAAAGTLAAPFATITKARDSLRTFAALENNVTIFIRAGTYTLSAPFTLTNADSGRNGFTITYRAYNNEAVVISGGTVITGWSLHDAAKNIYKATVGTTIQSRQFYVNGVRGTRATTKVTGWAVTATGYTANGVWIDTVANDTNIEVVSVSVWSEQRCRFASVSGATVTMANPGWYNGFRIWGDWTPLRIENAYEFIDSVSEWYLNRATGVLYYKPRTGEDMSTASAVLPIQEAILSGNNTANVSFKGLSFQYATWNRPSSDTGFAQKGGDQLFDTSLACGADWFQFTPPSTFSNCAYLIPGNITFTNSRKVLLDSCRFEHLGAIGVSFGLGCDSCTVTRSNITDVSASGVFLGDIRSLAGCTNSTISYDSIHNVAVEYRGCSGIFGLFHRGSLITHNIIFNLPYDGMEPGWGPVNNTATNTMTISYNRIFDVMKSLGDGGGIHLSGGQPGTKIINNHLTNTGIYLDQGSGYIRVENNVLDSNCGIAYVANWNLQGQVYDTFVNNFANYPIIITPATGDVISGNKEIICGPFNYWPIKAQRVIDSAGVTVQGLTYTPTIARDFSLKQTLSSLQVYTLSDSAYADSAVTHKLYRFMPGVDTTLIQTTVGNAMTYPWTARYKYNGATWIDSIFCGTLKTATLICTTVVALNAADYVTLSSNLTDNTTLTTGTYYLTTNIETGNYNLYFDLSGGNIYIKSLGYGFVHNGTGILATHNGADAKRLIFTSKHDNAHGAIIDSSTGTPAYTDRYARDIVSTGTTTCMDTIDWWESWYGRGSCVVDSNSVNAGNKRFVVRNFRLKYRYMDATNYPTWVGSPNATRGTLLAEYTVSNFTIDTTNHIVSTGGNSRIIGIGLAYTMTCSNGYINPTVVGANTIGIRFDFGGGDVHGILNNVAILKIGVVAYSSGGNDSITIKNCIISTGGVTGGVAGVLLSRATGNHKATIKDNVIYNCTGVGVYGVTSTAVFTRAEGNNVYYNNTADNDSAISATSWTTENPTFTTLGSPLKKLLTPAYFPNGLVVGNAAIKKHGSRTVSNAGITAATSTFDGTVIAAADTVTPGVWYSATTQQSSGGGRGRINTGVGVGP